MIVMVFTCPEHRHLLLKKFPIVDWHSKPYDCSLMTCYEKSAFAGFMEVKE